MRQKSLIRSKRMKKDRQVRRKIHCKVLNQSASETLEVTPSVVKTATMFDLNVMVQLCQSNWTLWMAQVASARLQQVSMLATEPSLENIDLLQSLEKLGIQIEMVRSYIGN